MSCKDHGCQITQSGISIQHSSVLSIQHSTEYLAVSTLHTALTVLIILAYFQWQPSLAGLALRAGGVPSPVVRCLGTYWKPESSLRFITISRWFSCVVNSQNRRFNSLWQLVNTDSPNLWNPIFMPSEGQVSCLPFTKTQLTAQQYFWEIKQ